MMEDELVVSCTECGHELYAMNVIKYNDHKTPHYHCGKFKNNKKKNENKNN